MMKKHAFGMQIREKKTYRMFLSNCRLGKNVLDLLVPLVGETEFNAPSIQNAMIDSTT